jgi:hypothetical protein
MKNRPGKNNKTLRPSSNDDAHVMEVGKESRLAQWSRRKAAARAQDTSRAEDAVTEQQALKLNAEEPRTAKKEPRKKEPSDKDMPSLESLDEHSDYSGFLSPNVSEKLRRQALRKLFHLDFYNFADGLDDYAEDYTKFAALGNVLTSDLRLQQQRAMDTAKDQMLTNDSQDSGPDFLSDDTEVIGDDSEGPVGNDSQVDPSPNEDQA